MEVYRCVQHVTSFASFLFAIVTFGSTLSTTLPSTLLLGRCSPFFLPCVKDHSSGAFLWLLCRLARERLILGSPFGASVEIRSLDARAVLEFSFLSFPGRVRTIPQIRNEIETIKGTELTVFKRIQFWCQSSLPNGRRLFLFVAERISLPEMVTAA